MEQAVLRHVLLQAGADCLGACRAVCRSWRDLCDAVALALFVEPLRNAADAILALSQDAMLSKRSFY